eukprot:641964_1
MQLISLSLLRHIDCNLSDVSKMEYNVFLIFFVSLLYLERWISAIVWNDKGRHGWWMHFVSIICVRIRWVEKDDNNALLDSKKTTMMKHFGMAVMMDCDGLARLFGTTKGAMVGG